MSKKMMLLALAAVSASIFALPAVASAQDAHIEGITTFTGTAGAGELRATGEPTITCVSGDVSGKFDTGSTTTGSLELDFTECHTTIFGFTAKCRTAGSALDNTIKESGTFHVITANNEPAILVTPATVTIVCAGISNVVVSGNGVIGTITSPGCGNPSNNLVVSFKAIGSTQEDRSYTGVEYDLKAQTSGGSSLTAGLQQTATLESVTKGTVVCT